MPRKHTRKNRRNRRKRGGEDPDIEMGPVPNVEYMGTVPPDPKRFEEYDRKAVERAFKRPSSPAETEAVFQGPTPDEKLKSEQMKMFYEDPHNRDPWQDLTIFSDKGGKRTRKRRRNKRKNSRKRRSRKGGEAAQSVGSNDRQKMLYRLQELMRLNQTNTQHFQELDDRLYDIEQMSASERQQHQDEYERLNNEIQQLRQTNDAAQREFEELRQQYMNQYMSTMNA